MRRPRFRRSSLITVFPGFFQMVGKELFFSLVTAPSTWTDHSNESGEKWSEQTAKRPSGLKCAQCVPMKAFHFAQRVSTAYGRKFRPIYQKHYCILAHHNIAKDGEQFFQILFLIACGTRPTTPYQHTKFATFV